MTPEELDERIYAAIHDGVTLATDNGQPYLAYTDEAEDLIKQLIRDCIEAVTPERDEQNFTRKDGKWMCLTCDEEVFAGICLCTERNEAIDTIEQNTKELLG